MKNTSSIVHKKSSRLSRIFVVLSAVTAMLLSAGIIAPAIAATDYSAGIKGEYNKLGINAGVATQMYSLTSQAKIDAVLKNFNQITPENSFKPEGWYDDDHNFRMSDDTRQLLKFASDNHIKIYGHVLVWYSQTPDWFFQKDQNCVDTNATEGATSCELADKTTMQERQRKHIENVAKAISDEFGLFGSDTNPVVAFDVVNETVNDGANEATRGMRNSLWYQTYGGEDYIYDAFKNASEFFNTTYAATDHPVKLFINDYNTEVAGKRARYIQLLQRMVENNVPFDGISHQFHVTLTTPVSNLDAALSDMKQFGKKQAISELDVTTGTPVTQGKLIDQGNYYYQVNQIIHKYASELFSVTVWGLSDEMSWRYDDGDPLLFDKDMKEKPAYVGYIGDKEHLPEPLKTMNAFKSDADETSSLEDSDGVVGVSSPWERVPATDLAASSDGAVSGNFKLYWKDGAITANVNVTDATKSDDDSVTIRVGSVDFKVLRNGTVSDTSAKATVAERTGGYEVSVSVPVASAEQKAVLNVNVIAHDAATGSTSAWSSNSTGDVTLVEELSYAEVTPASVVPQIDAETSDAAWQNAPAIELGKVTSSTPAPEAAATAKTVWSGHTLYVLMEVKDANVDLTNSNPWEKDSVEIYIDRGNTKSAQYTDTVQQIRVSADGKEVTFGAGASEEVQKSQVQTAAKKTKDGYVVELAIDLGNAQAGSFVGADFQINDAKDGARIGIRNWADPTGIGYQTAAHWGVVRLVNQKKTESETNQGSQDDTPSKPHQPNKPGKPSKPNKPIKPAKSKKSNPGQAKRSTKKAVKVIVGKTSVKPGMKLKVSVRNAKPYTGYVLWLFSTPVKLADVRTNSSGAANAVVTVPESTPAGSHHVVLTATESSDKIAQAPVTVLASQPAGAQARADKSGTVGSLAVTGVEISALVVIVAITALLGLTLVMRKRY